MDDASLLKKLVNVRLGTHNEGLTSVRERGIQTSRAPSDQSMLLPPSSQPQQHPVASFRKDAGHRVSGCVPQNIPNCAMAGALLRSPSLSVASDEPDHDFLSGRQFVGRNGSAKARILWFHRGSALLLETYTRLAGGKPHV